MKIEQLSNDHDRKDFLCQHASLENYLKYTAKKENKAGITKVYVLTEGGILVVGYYTLSSSLLPKDSIPKELLGKISNSYTGYPSILLGRLAIATPFQGKGLGGVLMVDAIERCIHYSKLIGTCAISVDPIDKNASDFYRKYMFKSLVDNNQMILRIDNNLRSHYSG